MWVLHPRDDFSGKGVVGQQSHPSETEIRQGISGNLCRCTGYVKIVEAIQAAARGQAVPCAL